MVLKLEQVADDKIMCNARRILCKIPVVTCNKTIDVYEVIVFNWYNNVNVKEISRVIKT